MLAFLSLVVLLLLALAWLTQVREGFLDLPDLKTLPDPQKLLKEMRVLLDRYDQPELWAEVTQRMDKDPGQLARMNLGIHN
jgi:hypothetical protein